MFLAVFALNFAAIGFGPSTEVMIPLKAKCTISCSSSLASIAGVCQGREGGGKVGRPGGGDGGRAVRALAAVEVAGPSQGGSTMAEACCGERGEGEEGGCGRRQQGRARR